MRVGVALKRRPPYIFHAVHAIPYKRVQIAVEKARITDNLPEVLIPQPMLICPPSVPVPLICPFS